MSTEITLPSSHPSHTQSGPFKVYNAQGIPLIMYAKKPDVVPTVKNSTKCECMWIMSVLALHENAYKIYVKLLKVQLVTVCLIHLWNVEQLDLPDVNEFNEVVTPGCSWSAVIKVLSRNSMNYKHALWGAIFTTYKSMIVNWDINFKMKNIYHKWRKKSQK